MSEWNPKKWLRAVQEQDAENARLADLKQSEEIELLNRSKILPGRYGDTIVREIVREVVYNSPEGIQKRYATDYLNSKAPIINLFENESKQMAPPRDDLLEHHNSKKSTLRDAFVAGGFLHAKGDEPMKKQPYARTPRKRTLCMIDEEVGMIEPEDIQFAEHHQGGFRTPAQVVHVALQEPEPVSAPRKPYYEMWGLVKATGLFMSLGLLLGGVFMYGMSTIR